MDKNTNECCDHHVDRMKVWPCQCDCHPQTHQECDHHDCPRSCWQQDPNKVHQGWEDELQKFGDFWWRGNTEKLKWLTVELPLKDLLSRVVAQAEAKGAAEERARIIELYKHTYPSTFDAFMNRLDGGGSAK